MRASSAMALYLMQHAQATLRTPDGQRALSDEGRATLERMANRYAQLRLEIERIYHSGVLRAQQTAAVVAERLDLADRLTEQPLLEPDAPAKPIAKWLAKEHPHGEPGVLLVGHQPSLGALAGLLLAGDDAADVLRLHNAGLVKLVPALNSATRAKAKAAGIERYAVEWILTPELV